ncbi:hypothetical protein PAMP_019293 [Pampus punctatissimus]
MSTSTSPRFFTETEVARNSTKDSCWVLLGTKIYDVTAFLRMHPGGEALILRRSGKDVSQEMEGPPHRHSENARRWMEQYYIGELDRDSAETQVFLSSVHVSCLFYNSQELLRVHHRGDTLPAALFTFAAIETADTAISAQVKASGGSPHRHGNTWKRERERERTLRERRKTSEKTEGETAEKTTEEKDLVDWRKPLAWQVGHLGEKYDAWVHQPVDRPIRLFGNSFLEASTKTSCSYHIKLLSPQSPFDGSRLVFPPGLASLVVGSFYAILHTVLPEILGISVFVGGLCGYVVYDMIHYYLHYGSPKKGSYMYGLKAYHVKHHFEHQRAGFGITSTFWDHPFNTVIPDEKF